MAEQNFANHAQLVPGYHYVVLPALILNFGWAVYHCVRTGFSLEGVMGVVAALAILLGVFYARTFALKVQDRVIRVEERLRLERLLPADLQPRIGEFSTGQLIALRFASDAELPELARKVLTDKIAGRKAIKEMVKNWRADELRA